ncbi:hypothetical protein CEXT_633621 [Caerostris extrusa]|uniref:Transposase n=1 Tax=Caerostris extrusa TaxID=172846 RepID=A0AAV4RDW7_CAEEX|nr:hypothetical protein CEXT_633621 [Caerostris extrusa]
MREKGRNSMNMIHGLEFDSERIKGMANRFVFKINALCCKNPLDAMDLFIYLDERHLRTRHRPPINRSHQIRAMGIQSNCRRASFSCGQIPFCFYSHLLQD